MTSVTGEATTPDGTSLLIRAWPSAGQAWAAVLIVHGFGEHSGRYDSVAEPLARAGLEVRSFDQRGFGSSGGRRAFVDRWEQLGEDVRDRLTALRSELPAVPIVLYGHSLGGLVVLDAVTRGAVRADALILSAPALGDAIPPWRRRVAKVLDRIVPTLRVPSGMPGDGLSRDPAVAAAVAGDALNLSWSTVRLGAAAFRAQDTLGTRLAALRDLPVPTYVLHGDADPIVPVGSSEVLMRFPSVTRIVHAGLRHEPHHEPEAPAVVDSIIAWLRDVTRPSTVVSPVARTAAAVAYTRAQ
ncbi:MAG TPA: alpha/beta hydrolase [Candidatus Limnocylindrales bacterium]|nr:alpha/beta hydrolase [Candidatus Limnocylindrales bacterium]